jgi:hypothetical protein
MAMGFFKKSDDPWDQKPGQPPTAQGPQEKRERPLDALKQWNQDRKAEKARRAAECAPEPIPCPWCGRRMELRYLWSMRSVYLSEKKPGLFTTVLSWDNQALCDEGSILTGLYKTVWYCRDCRRLAADVKEPEETSTFAAEAPDQGGNEE